MQNFQSRHGFSLSEDTVQCVRGPVICSSWGGGGTVESIRREEQAVQGMIWFDD